MLNEQPRVYKSDTTGKQYTVDKDVLNIFDMNGQDEDFDKDQLKEYIRELIVMAQLMGVDIFENEKEETNNESAGE